MSEPETPFWLAWVVSIRGALSAVGVTAAGYVIRKLFISAVENVTQGMHHDNQLRFGEVEKCQRAQAETLAWIKGRMEERWGKGDE